MLGGIPQPPELALFTREFEQKAQTAVARRRLHTRFQNVYKHNRVSERGLTRGAGAPTSSAVATAVALDLCAAWDTGGT
jgi:hypothetical protein